MLKLYTISILLAQFDPLLDESTLFMIINYIHIEGNMIMSSKCNS